MSKITYAVVLNPNFTAELHWKEGKSKFVNKKMFALNSNFDLTHINNRQIVNNVLTENNIIVTADFDIKEFETGTQMIYGQATKLHKTTLFEWSNEAGFSLMELTVSCAIMVVIGAIAMSYYIPAGQKIIQQVEDVKAMQASQPDTEFLIEFN